MYNCIITAVQRKNLLSSTAIFSFQISPHLCLTKTTNLTQDSVICAYNVLFQDLYTALFQDFLKSTIIWACQSCVNNISKTNIWDLTVFVAWLSTSMTSTTIMENYAICCLCLTKLHDCIHQQSKQTYK